MLARDRSLTTCADMHSSKCGEVRACSDFTSLIVARGDSAVEPFDTVPGMCGRTDNLAPGTRLEAM